jgi:hypothetical protein
MQTVYAAFPVPFCAAAVFTIAVLMARGKECGKQKKNTRWVFFPVWFN